MTGYSYDPKRVLVLSHAIDDKSVLYFIKKIVKFNAHDREKEHEDPDYVASPIHIIVNSYGGNIYDGLALIGAIETSVTEIHVTCMGSCMSMAMFIFLAGHKRFMQKYSTLMYHAGTTWIEGNLGNLKNETKEMERVEMLLDQMLFSKTKVTPKMIKLKTKDRENWYITASSAHRLKITDQVI